MTTACRMRLSGLIDVVWRFLMNLILLFQNDFIDNTNRVRLQGRRLRHVLDVHRAQTGDSLRVGLLGARMGFGRILALDADTLKMEVNLDQEPPQALPVTLVLALPRPKVLRRVLRSACAMGVKRIILMNAQRVEKSFWQSPFLKREHLDEQLVLGLEQARDTILPRIELHTRFIPFVEDELPGLIKGTLGLVAHPAAAEAFPCSRGQAVTLVIGPEGGFIPYEIDKLVSLGFTPVTLGERILSVETAIPSLLARLS